MKKVLIANRGEIAVRIARAAADCGIASVAIYSSDDKDSLHVVRADEGIALQESGVPAYLNTANIIKAAISSGADCVHPGYGFLSENADFARACNEAGLCFIGPDPSVLEQLGDKLQARCLARDLNIPVAAGSFDAINQTQAKTLLDEFEDGLMLKAVSGGGGRGIRPVRHRDEFDTAWQHCSSEALNAFGSDALYVEQLLPASRHIEVQILGDGEHCIAVGERDCSLQRRHQKLIEIAPAPGLPSDCRDRLFAHACDLGRAVGYRGVGTVEFMLWDNWQQLAFIEVNPRLQVEHTVTEETTGLDLVRLQFQLAAGAGLAELGVSTPPTPDSFAIQSRVNMERVQANGTFLPAGGTLSAFEPPNGPRLRVDHFAYNGYTSNPHYDSLLAKVISHSPSATFQNALKANYRALCEFRIAGLETNLDFLKNILQHPKVLNNSFTTAFIDEAMSELVGAEQHPQRYVVSASQDATNPGTNKGYPPGPQGSHPLMAEMQGSIQSVAVAAGEHVAPGQELMLMESMKLEHVISVPEGAIIAQLAVEAGDTALAGQPLLHYFIDDKASKTVLKAKAPDLDHIRPDLEHIQQLHAHTLDSNRQEKLDKLRARGKQTARENIDQLTEGGDFIEYGALALAAQRGRKTLDELKKNTPADGLITGVGEVNRTLFDAQISRTAILAYDYSVIAGTQGYFNHAKTDRLVEVVEKSPMPLIFFAEGGGGRPGDVDTERLSSSGLNCTSFGNLAALNGKHIMVGVNAGYCFAGNAAFLALNDVIISTRSAWLGMGGPAMIEGGGLGTVDKNEIGPIEIQIANGTIDVVVDNERDAVIEAKKFLAYFQGNTSDWKASDQRLLRHCVPENRSRAYDVREVIRTLADTDSVLELRPQFAQGYITALARVEGKPIAIMANNNQVLSGAIDAEGARKANRFMQLCERFGLRILFLVDCPGFIVGPEYEKQGTVRAAGDLYVTAAGLSVPTAAIILRKAYGLGAMAAMAGSSKAPSFTVAWPSGEAGPMGLEGAIKLGFKKELEAIADPDEQESAYTKMLAQAYETAKTTNSAALVEIDAVIDPRDSRRWINQIL